ncbi:MAG: hypothetical protein AABZ47_10120, partial [Planctomycetota bacterium]
MSIMTEPHNDTFPELPMDRSPEFVPQFTTEPIRREVPRPMPVHQIPNGQPLAARGETPSTRRGRRAGA